MRKLTIGAAIAAFLLLAPPAAAHPDPFPTPPVASQASAGGVALGTQVVEPWQYVHDGIPVSAVQHNAPRVVYSVQVNVPAPGEYMLVRGEVLMSKCNEPDTLAGGGQGQGDTGSPCEPLPDNQPYGYDPDVHAKIVVGPTPTSTAGGSWTTRTCTKERHHCPLALSEPIGVGPGTHYVNLVVSADDPQRRPDDVVELEADCAGAARPYDDCHPAGGFTELFDGSHGKLDVVRFGAGRTANMPAVTDASRNVTSLPDSQTTADPKRVVYSVPVSLGAGDLIDVDAELRTAPAGPTGNPLVSAAVIIADSPTATTGEHVTAWNGANCNNPNSNPCTNRKFGVGLSWVQQVRYVNVVARSTRDDSAVPDLGHLTVTRHPAQL
jgi:hypothetical protein